MPNSNYIKGRRYEYKLIKEHKLRGFDICQRSAGSRSPVDIFCINFKDRIIKFNTCAASCAYESPRSGY